MSIVRLAWVLPGLSLLLFACEISGNDSKIWAHENNRLPVVQGVRYGQLANGMRYAIAQNKTPQNEAIIRFQINVGSIHELDGEQGLVHFIEHMAFQGSENLPQAKFAQVLATQNLDFKTDFNGQTDTERTMYRLALPDAQPEQLDSGLFLMREIADKLTFEPSLLEQERAKVISENTNRQGPDWQSMRANTRFAFPHLRSTIRQPIGDVQVLGAASREDIINLYERYYRPERSILIVVGDFDLDEMESRIQVKFNDWQKSETEVPEPDRGRVELRELEAEVFTHETFETKFSILKLVKPKIVQDSDKARRAVMVSVIANNILNLRLDQIAQSIGAPFTSAQVYGVNQSTNPTALVAGGSMIISAPAETWRQGLAMAALELRYVLEFGFSQTELDAAIANFRTGMQKMAEEAVDQHSVIIADEILRAYAGHLVYTSAQNELDRFNSLATDLNRETVLEELRSYWADGDPLIFMSTNTNATAERVKQTWLQAKQVELTAPVEPVKLEFAYTNFGKAGRVVWQDHVVDFDIHRFRLANNVMLNYKHSAFDPGRVQVNVSLGAGRSSQPKNAPGLNGLAQYALMAGGLKKHDIGEIRQILSGRTVGVSAKMNDQNLNLYGVTDVDDFELQMQLSAAYVTDAAWREQPTANFFKSVDDMYAGKDTNARVVSDWNIPKLVRSNDNRFGWPERDQMFSLKVADAQSWIGEILDHASIEISIVGDIDQDQAVQIVAKTFGALAKREPLPRASDGGRAIVFATGENPTTLFYTGDGSLARVRMHWSLPGASEAGISALTRMADSILESKIAARAKAAGDKPYPIFAFWELSEAFTDFGYIGLNIDVEPSKIPEMIKIADEVIAQMARGEISDEEVEAAKLPILTRNEDDIDDNIFWWKLASYAQTNPQEMQNMRTRQADLRAITKTNLQEYAAKYMGKGKDYRVLILPAETK
ncbi:MAG: hypothetical protein COA47_03295 [Robiginitomaculum sp.]|nr:MAG: hypothetical protein COA47_03295 [Robiginitomaculum sp.]